MSRVDIRGVIPLSLLDYRGNPCMTLFTAGCNFLCPFCHNPDLVLSPHSLARIQWEPLLLEMEKRRGLITAVCISGGEPTLQNGLGELLSEIKSIGLKVKLDTNGSRPQVIQDMLSLGYVDYVAMDIKADPERYSEASGVQLDTEVIWRSTRVLMNSEVDYEFRTTAVPGLIHEATIAVIGRWLAGARRYVIQQYRPDTTLSPDYGSMKPFQPSRLFEFADVARPFFGDVEVRV